MITDLSKPVHVRQYFKMVSDDQHKNNILEKMSRLNAAYQKNAVDSSKRSINATATTNNDPASAVPVFRPGMRFPSVGLRNRTGWQFAAAHVPPQVGRIWQFLPG